MYDSLTQSVNDLIATVATTIPSTDQMTQTMVKNRLKQILGILGNDVVAETPPVVPISSSAVPVVVVVPPSKKCATCSRAKRSDGQMSITPQAKALRVLKSAASS